MFAKTIQRILDTMFSARKNRPQDFEIMRASEPSLQFLLPINNSWEPVASHVMRASELFDHYLNPASPSDEVLAAAIVVHADGTPWNRTDHSETFTHVESWLSACAALLSGDSAAHIWAFEESGMEAVVNGERIILQERTHHRPYQLPPVCFNLRPFAKELANSTAKGVELVSRLKRVAAERYPVQCRLAVGYNEKLSAPTEVMAINNRAAALDELDALEKRMWAKVRSPDYHPPLPTDEQVRSTRLEKILNYLAGEGLTSSWARLAAVAGLTT
jgi:hypothetical protein